MNECVRSIAVMMTGITREKSLSQLPVRPTKVWVFGYARECRQGRKNLTSLSSAYAAYSEDLRFKYCLRESSPWFSVVSPDKPRDFIPNRRWRRLPAHHFQSTGKGKGKAVPLQIWSGPEGSRKLRFADYVTMTQNGGKVVSLTHRPFLPPGNTPGTHFC
jgi:hypothetical protein